jgi:hypothetical protein
MYGALMPLMVTRQRTFASGLGVVVVVVVGLGILLTAGVSSRSSFTLKRQLVNVAGLGDQRSASFVITASTVATLAWSGRGALEVTVVSSGGTGVEPSVNCEKTCSGSRSLKLQPGEYHLDVQGAANGVEVSVPT